MRRGNVFEILVLAVSLCLTLFLQGQTDVFNVGPTDDLPEMMTADGAKNTEELEYLKRKPEDTVDPVVVLPALPSIAPWLAFVNTNDELPMNHAPPIWRFLRANPPTAPPAA